MMQENMDQRLESALYSQAQAEIKQHSLSWKHKVKLQPLPHTPRVVSITAADHANVVVGTQETTAQSLSAREVSENDGSQPVVPDPFGDEITLSPFIGVA